MSHFYYHCYGFAIASDLFLPELTVGYAGDPEIVIASETVDWDVDDTPNATFSCRVLPDGGAFLSWSKLGKIFVAGDGTRISVDPDPNIEDALLRIMILGTALASAARNRGRLMLHASAVQVGNAACLFLGNRGAGKSTMSIAMHTHGCRLLSDDVVAIDADPKGESPLQVYHGITRSKLWPDSAEALGCNVVEMQPLYSSYKKLAYTPSGAHTDPDTTFPLEAIILLEVGNELRAEPMAAQQALLNLLPNCYVGQSAKELVAQRRPMDFLQCGRLAREVKVFSLYRPADLTLLSKVARYVEQLVQSQALAGAVS